MKWLRFDWIRTKPPVKWILQNPVLVRPVLQVTDVAVSSPAWADVPVYHVGIVTQFNKPFRPQSVAVNNSFKLDMRCRDREAHKVRGTIKTNPANPREFAFISDETLAALVNPMAAQNVSYTITLTDDICDLQHARLDGDKNGAPGGDYVKTIEVVG